MVLGLVETFVVVRVLSVSEWGLVQLAVSVGGAFGIYQHLGLASGSTREISASSDDDEVVRIFFTSVFIRYLVTIPIAIFLLVSAESIAVGQYSNAALILPIRLYAVALVIESVQSILNSVISGTKRFKALFIYQAVIALVNVCVYVPMVLFFKVNGYFYGMILFNVIATTALTIIAFKPYVGKISLPGREDFLRLLKQLMSISLAIYAVKVIYTWWEKSGPLLLGRELSAEMVAFFAFALLYAKKLMIISDSITTVNLPVLSEKFTSDKEDFENTFKANFNKTYAFILGSGFFAIFWSREIFFVLVGGDKYSPALPLVLPLMVAFMIYSFINIIESSVLIPAKRVATMIVSFGCMLLVTVAGFFLLKGLLDPMIVMAYSLALGGLVGLSIMTLVSQRSLNFGYIDYRHALLFLQIIAISLPYMLENLLLKGLLFVVFGFLYWQAVRISDFMTFAQVKSIFTRGFSQLGKLSGLFNRS
jgi:O-antigen/teichoic acid export membrane protein